MNLNLHYSYRIFFSLNINLYRSFSPIFAHFLPKNYLFAYFTMLYHKNQNVYFWSIQVEFPRPSFSPASRRAPSTPWSPSGTTSKSDAADFSRFCLPFYNTKVDTGDFRPFSSKKCNVNWSFRIVVLIEYYSHRILT